MMQEHPLSHRVKRSLGAPRVMPLPISALILLVSMTLLALPASAQMIDEELSAGAGELLRLELETGASVTITGWDKNAVSVKTSAGNPERYRTSIERQGNTILVKSDFAVRKKNNTSNMRMEISVPRTFDVKIQSTGGSLHISDVEGRFEGKTMGGKLELHRLIGTAKLETMGGNILVTDSELDGKVSTRGGKVTMRNIVGTLDGSSMGGNVTLENVRRPDGSSTGDVVTISTMGGKIDVALAPSGAKLKTMGGAIRVDSAREFVDAHTMGGNINLTEVEGWVKALTMGGDITVQVIGVGSDGAADIELESMGGDVLLTVPRGFSMEVDIEIAYTKRHAGKHEIKSDVALQLSGTDTWEREEHGTPRRYLYGKASIGGGEHRVTIRTVNGDVILREE